MNTIKKGQIRFLIFKEKGEKLFTGVCLDFGIVLQDKNEEKLKCELEQSALGYLKTVAKDKMNEDLLNNQAEKKYFDLYEKFLKEELKRASSKKEVKTNLSNRYINMFQFPVNQLTGSNICYA
jgi:hypothetical protein